MNSNQENKQRAKELTKHGWVPSIGYRIVATTLKCNGTPSTHSVAEPRKPW